MAQSLDDMILVLQDLAGDKLNAQIVLEAAPLVDEVIKATARAGQSPDGVPWPPRKKDGEPALQNVVSQIRTAAFGDVMRTTLSGPAAYSNYGAGIPRRQVIPDSAEGVPQKVQAAFQKAASNVFEKITSRVAP